MKAGVSAEVAESATEAREATAVEIVSAVKDALSAAKAVVSAPLAVSAPSAHARKAPTIIARRVKSEAPVAKKRPAAAPCVSDALRPNRVTTINSPLAAHS